MSFQGDVRARQFILRISLAVMVLLGGVWIRMPDIVHANDVNFNNGITVDSVLDVPDDNISDSICDDGAGNCTLRAAIEESNDTAGTQTINFNISSGTSFTNDGQTGYTITPFTNLPNITDQVVINGYSQPNAQTNTAQSPNPLNGRLLIEIDGTNVSVGSKNCFELDNGSDNAIIKGLVINRCQGSAISIADIDSAKIEGNYIGTDPTGLTARSNGAPSGGSSVAVGVGANCNTSTDTNTTNTVLGGSTAAARNLISGNRGAGMGICAVDTTVQGNYVGLASDGLTAMGNSVNVGDGSGGATIDYADGVLIGGVNTGEMNIFSGNYNAGVSPYRSENMTVQGNYFGLGYDGSTMVPNDSGFNCGECDNVLIGGTVPAARNIFSGNTNSGLNSDTNNTNMTVYGNYMGTDKTGMLARPNKVGLALVDSSNITVGGAGSQYRNVIAGNTVKNVQLGLLDSIAGVTDSTIQGNYIGVDASGTINGSFDNGAGMLIEGPSHDNRIGGKNSGEGNIIAGNRGGILVSNYVLTGFGIFAATNNAIIGNSIYANDGIPPYPDFSVGIGIDNLEMTENDFPPDGFDSSDMSGPNTNSVAGWTSGEANDYLNHPVITKVQQTGITLDVDFSLVAAGSTSGQYRVEFFANDDNTPGQGKQYLGFKDVAPGTALNANFTTSSSGDMAGKYITATTTMLNSPGTNDGFGSTSEFSTALAAEVLAAESTEPQEPDTSDKLAQTGQYTRTLLLFGVASTAIVAFVVLSRRRYIYKAEKH